MLPSREFSEKRSITARLSSGDIIVSSMCLVAESPVLPSQAEAEMNYYPSEEIFGLLGGQR